MMSEREPFTTEFSDCKTPRIDTEYMDGYIGYADADPSTHEDVVTVGEDNGYTDGDDATTDAHDDVMQVAGTTDDAPVTIDGVTVPPQYRVSDHDPEYTEQDSQHVPMIDQLPEGIRVIGGVAYIEEDVPDRVQVVVRIDREFKRRMSVISNLERRTMTVVVEEAIRQFMSEPINEPRPYLPPELSNGQDTRLAFYMTSDEKYLLEVRARDECRSVMDLVRRALADYVGRSPYDPERYMKVIRTSETAQNPLTIDDDVQEVSEYHLTDESRLSPSEAQKTGDDPSEGVTE